MGLWLMASESKTLPLWTSLSAATWWFWSKSIRSLRLPCVLWEWGSSLCCNATREKEPLSLIWKCSWRISLSSTKCLPSVYSDSIGDLTFDTLRLGVSTMVCPLLLRDRPQTSGLSSAWTRSLCCPFYLHGNSWKLLWASNFSTADSFFSNNTF